MLNTKFKLAAVALSTFALAAGLTLGPQPAVHAQSSSGGPAVTILNCPNFSNITSSDGYIFTICFDEIITSSGNNIFKFHGSLIPGSVLPSQTVQLNDVLCFFNQNQEPVFGTAIITPSGKVNGTC